jgi:hypothetical protein
MLCSSARQTAVSLQMTLKPFLNLQVFCFCGSLEGNLSFGMTVVVIFVSEHGLIALDLCVCVW